jgi:hypothetical protein
MPLALAATGTIEFVTGAGAFERFKRLEERQRDEVMSNSHHSAQANDTRAFQVRLSPDAFARELLAGAFRVGVGKLTYQRWNCSGSPGGR